MKYLAIGQMSGTSLDGCDWVEVEFDLERPNHFNIINTATMPYSNEMSMRLRMARHLTGMDLARLASDYEYLLTNLFSEFWNPAHRVDVVALHGHTIFHQPDKGFSTQIGTGRLIAEKYGQHVVSDFRNSDIALGGQGAPLVPIGDELLFSNYDACINLGGYANISFIKNGQRIAFDIGPCNFPLNYLAQQMGQPFDRGGEIARTGEIDTVLKERIITLPYFSQSPPKSLGNEWFDNSLKPILNNSSLTIEDQLATVTSSVAEIISHTVHSNQLQRILVTGGGAYNTYLIETLRTLQCDLHIPDRKIVEYKEALIFALMGVLRITGRNNVISSATGAQKDHSAGIHLTP